MTISTRFKANCLSLIAVLGVWLPALLVSADAATSKSPEQARKELAQLGLEYSANTFLKSCYEGDTIAVELFLAAGMDVATKDAQGSTPLLMAAANGHTNVITLLIRKGADVNSKQRISPLLAALVQDHLPAATILVEKGADPDCVGPREMRPLHFAAGFRDGAMIKLLLAKGAQPDAQNADGVTPLMIAAQKGNLECVSLLLKAHSQVDLPDPGGATALMFAVKRGQSRTAELLIQAGANVNARDKGGNTVLDTDLSDGRGEMRQMLQKCGAHANQFARKMIEDAARQVKRTGYDGTPPTVKARAIEQLGALKTSELLDDDLMAQARQKIAEAIRDVAYSHQMRRRSGEKSEAERREDQDFADVVQEILMGVAPEGNASVPQEPAKPQADPPSNRVPSLAQMRYDKELDVKIKARWSDLRRSDSQDLNTERIRGKVTVTFTLMANGNVVNISSRGDDVGELPESICRRAVEVSAPFPQWSEALERAVGARERTIKITFYYE